MTSYWHCQIAGQDHGPYTAEQLAAFAREGRITALDFVREANSGNWRPASQVAWLTFSPSRPVDSPGDAPIGAPTRSRESTALAAWVLVGMAAIAAVCLGIFALLLFLGADGSNGAHGEAALEAPNARAVARLHVSGRDATSELQAFVAGLPAEQRALLGVAALATGDDIYAAEITLANTGSLPIQVYPENLTIHYGTDSTAVVTCDDPRFLQASVLQPGQYARGLVLYQARIEVGAAMRLGGGGFAYNDPTITVKYGR